MKIRNEKVVNKLRRIKGTIHPPTVLLEEDSALEALKEESLSNISNSDYYTILFGGFFVFTGIAAFINFLLVYFFDTGISFYDSAFIFAVLGSIVVYGVASMINRFAIRDLLYSDKSFKEKIFIMEHHQFIKGWKRSLVYCVIVTLSLLFAYLGVSLMFVDGSPETVAYMVFLYAVIMSLFEIIKPDKDIPYFSFILLMGFIYLLAQWFITENEIDEDYSSLSDYIAYDVFGIEPIYTETITATSNQTEHSAAEFGLECAKYDGFLNRAYTEQAYAAILEGYMPYDITENIQQSRVISEDRFNAEIHDQPLPEMTTEEAERGFYDIEQIYEKKRNELIK